MPRILLRSASVIVVAVLAGCSVESVDILDRPLDPIVIVDQDGRSWDITLAVRRYGFDPAGFRFGLGASNTPPLLLPVLAAPGDSGYPAPGDSFDVAGLVLDADVRAYDLGLLLGFEVVDDVAAARAIAVVYQPAAGDLFAVNRVSDGVALTLSASGWVYGDRSVLFDWETGSLWYRLSGRPGLTAVDGPLVGHVLTPVPVERAAWRDWHARHPDSRVLPPPSS